MKIMQLILLVFVIALAIDYFGRSSLVKEIAGLDEKLVAQTELFPSVKSDSILQKYIPVGSSKEQAIDMLEKSGFKIWDYPLPSGRTFADVLKYCSDSGCDDIVLALYTYKFMFIIPIRYAQVEIAFKDGKAITVAGGYYPLTLY